MAIEAGRGTSLDVGTVLAAALTVTAISKASEAVVTASNTFANGDYVMFGEVEGMVELSYVVARVKSVSGANFTLEGVDSTNFGTWTSGTCQKVTTWSTLSTATSVDFGSGSVEQLDATTLRDTRRKSAAGLLAASDATVNLFTDYSQTVQAYIDTSAVAGSVIPFRVTKQSGHKRCFAGTASQIGESMNVNQLYTGSFTIIGRSDRHVKYTT